MNWLSWLGLGGGRRRREQLRARMASHLAAKYDAAQTTVDNERHWAQADALGARAATDPAVRARLRQRSRYECVESNSYGRGIVRTLANDCVGTGPTIEVLGDADQRLETAWRAWSDEINLPEILRVARSAKVVDGEVFLRLRTRNVPAGRVALGLEVLEGDQVDDLYSQARLPTSGRRVDQGVEFGDDGQPVAYWIQPHPGEQRHPGDQPPERVPADHVIHWFRADRPGQIRGVPETAAALPLFAQLRRYTLATLAAAELAADHAGIMHTDQPIPALETVNEADWFQTHDIERGALLALPEGWKMSQLKAEQPTTTYGEFKRELLGEIGRTVCMPVSVVTGETSSNYASGRLDYQIYRTSIEIERQAAAAVVLTPIWRAFLREYLAISAGLSPGDLAGRELERYAVAWGWPPFPYVDPSKEVRAQMDLWDRGLLSDEEFDRARNRDHTAHREAIERQLAWRRSAGAPLPGVSTVANVTDQEEAAE